MTSGLADRLAGLHAACFPPGERWDARAMAELLSTHGCAALHDVAGLVLLRVIADEGEILTLGVCPALRRRGHARRLLEQAVIHAAGAGARRLFIDVAASNAPAIALYEQAGFRDVGRRPRYYDNGDDARVMALDLPALG